MDRTLSREDARAYYERFAEKQDSQGWYEDAALDRLIDAGGFSDAHAVLELGCGTGRFARQLLDRHLPKDAHYLGLDISSAMLTLAAERLQPHGDRAMLALADATAPLPVADRSFDRLIAAYLLDLLPRSGAQALIGEAARALAPGGLLCLASLTQAQGGLTGLVARSWSAVQRLAPNWVGGCRPVLLTELLDVEQWEVIVRETVSPWSVASEVVVARRR